MKKLLLLGLLCVIPSTALAVDSITIDLGGTPAVISIPAPRKANIDKLLARINLRRAAQTPALPPISREQFVQMLFVTAFQQYDTEAATLTTAGDADFCTIFKDDAQTTGAQRNAVLAVGKGASPCPQ